MLIREIGIENFRCLKSVRIEDFSNVNFIFGRNNCGKSSVLEALFLGSYGSPEVLFENRGLNQPSQIDDFNQFFYERSMSNKPCIDMGEYKVGMHINGTDFRIRYFHDDKPLGLKVLSVLNGSLQEKNEVDDSSDNDALVKPGVFVPVGERAAGFDLDGIETIIDDGEEDAVTQILQSMDSSITGWIMGVNNTIRIEFNNNKRMVINLTGDGTRKAFALSTYLYRLKNGMIFVDEIENGLHYESITVVLKFIIQFVRKFPETQLFITSHSADVLRSLDALMEEEPEREDLISVYSLDRYDGDESSVWRHDRESLRHALDYEIEIR